MKNALKTIKCTLIKLIPTKRRDDGLMMYFKAEYKKNPEEAHDYWMNTGSKDYY